VDEPEADSTVPMELRRRDDRSFEAQRLHVGCECRPDFTRSSA
jgi:hypothetical protein